MDLYNTENPHYMYTYVSDTVYCRRTRPWPRPRPRSRLRPPSPGAATAAAVVTGAVLRRCSTPIDRSSPSSKSTGLVAASAAIGAAAVACAPRGTAVCRCCCCRTGRSRSRHASWGVLRIHRRGCPAGSSERPSIGSLQRAVQVLSRLTSILMKRL